jgi:hypothetical protein
MDSPKLKRTYLIQRLEKPVKMDHPIFGKDNPFSFGGGLQNGGLSAEAMNLLRPIFAFDYMGAAEFEFGAVPESLTELHQSKRSCGTVLVDKDRPVYYICKKEHEEEVKTILPKIYEGEIRTKEYVGLDYYFKEKDPRVVGWLEIDNGFFFFGNKEMYEKTKELFPCE